MRRVVVTGLGCISGLGQGVAPTWQRAIDGDGAIRMIDRENANAPHARMVGPAAPIDQLSMVSAEARFGARALAALDPLSTYAAIAALEAIDAAMLFGDPILQQGAAILIGAGSGGNATFDAAFQRLYARSLLKVHPQTIPMAMTSAPASQVAMLFSMRGPAFVVSSACASSAHAIGEAMWMIRSGRVDVAVAGGSEACLTPGSWIGWKSLGVMASETCRPFSADRDGLVLGEGAAILVLEERNRALARGAYIHGEVIGYAATADAAHITAPDQTGIEATIRAAHRDAELGTDVPVLISSHGTGTELNDRTEAAAIRAVYAGGLNRSHVIATKSAHGHLIGGSGALEFLLGLIALQKGRAPPVLGYRRDDPDCALPLAFGVTPIVQRHLVSNSFAFGGLNAVLIAQVDN
jgi:nodulation protein E